MGFSQKKKSKIKKATQKRRRKESKYIIGRSINDEDGVVQVVLDRLIVQGDVYILVQKFDSSEYYIRRFVSYGDMPQISPKRVLKNKKSFQRAWQDGTKVQIADDGTVSVRKENDNLRPYPYPFIAVIRISI